MLTEQHSVLLNLVMGVKGFDRGTRQLEAVNTIVGRLGDRTLPKFAKVGSVQMTNFKKNIDDTTVPMKRFTIAGENVAGGMNKVSYEAHAGNNKLAELKGGFNASVTAADKSHKSFRNLAGGVLKLGARAAMVAPLWMVMRSVLMSTVQAVQDNIKTYIDLEREMGRVATVTRGGESDLKKLKVAVIDYSATASKGFKEAASAVYALGCLKPDGLILTSEGVKEIQYIKKGDKVFGFDGQLTKVVSDLIVRDCSEKEIVKIKTVKNLPFEVTPNHPVFGVKSVKCFKKSIYNKICKNSCKRQCKAKPYENYKLEWIPAGELKEGDFLVIPKIKKRQDVTLNFDFGRNKKIVKNFPKKLDNDFALFLGTILGDGWAGKDGERVGIAFGNKDKEHKEWCQKYVNKLGYSYFRSSSVNKEKTCSQLVIWSRVLNKFIAKHIGRKAWNKRIPMFMFNAKDELIYSFLRGYYLSDGTKIRGEADCNISYRTTSPHITYSINYLVSKLGSSFILDKYIPDVNAKIKGKVYKYHPSYGITSSNFKGFANKICDLEKPNRPKFQKTWQDNNYIYFRITDIEKKFYDGKVYNFETKDNTYSVGVIVHNSAGLTVSQQMAGFKHIMDLSIGTFGNTEEIAKLVAGSFNVFGESLKGAYTESAKFKKITDILAFTYSEQQVEMSEIATAMTYVASIGKLVNVSFETLVTTIGVLNSGLLRGTKSGCYDNQTEVLTKKGFKLFKDVNIDKDIFATLNPETQKLEYQKASRKVDEHYSGLMYEAKNKHLDLLVTPDHWMYVADKRDGKYKREHARDIFGKDKYYKTGLKINERKEFSSKDEKTVENYKSYNDKIYCVEVPNHILFIRRNGKTVWCGNTALMNAFIALATKGDKLATLGVAFDPSKPLDFVNVMEQLHNIYGKQGKSLAGLKDLMDVFGRRGGRAAAQLVQDFERWKTALDDAEAKFEDFTETMREKAEDTLPAAFDKLWNSIKAGFVGALDTSGISSLVKQMAEVETRISKLRKYKRLIGEPAHELMGTPAGPQKTYLTEGTEEQLEYIERYKDLADIIEEVLSTEKKVKDVKIKAVSFAKEMNIQAEYLHEGLIDEKSVREHLTILLQLHGNLTEKEKEREKDIVNVMMKQIQLKKEELKLETKLRTGQEKKIETIDRAAKLDLMRVAGYTEEDIIRTKIADKITDVNKQLALHTDEQLKSLDIAELTSGQFDKWEEALIHVAGTAKDLYEIRKLTYKLDLESLKEIEGYGKKLKASFQGTFADFLSGEATLSDVFTKSSETFKKTLASAFSEGMTENIFNITGMDEMMGGFASKLKYAGQGMAGKMKEGYDYHVKLFRQLFREHAAGAGGGYAGGMVGGRTIGGGFGIPGITMPGFGVGGFMSQPFGDTANLYGVKGGKTGPAPRGQRTPATYGQILGVAGLTTMAVEGGGGLGTAGGLMSGVGGAAMGAAMLGIGQGVAATAGSAAVIGSLGFLGPLGIALMIGGMIMSSMQEAPTTRREEVKEQTRQISSRIDISNKQLDFVNRNLVSLREELTFIMSKSFYFSERDEVTNFAIGSARGGA